MTKPRPSWWGTMILPLILAGGFVMLAQLTSVPVLAQDDLPIGVRPPTPREELPAFAADQLIVKFKPNIPEQAIEQLKTEHGASEIRVSQFAGFITLSLPEGANVTAKAEIFSRNPAVEYAHPNFFAQADLVPNDTFYANQWHFDDDNTINTGGASSNPFGGANGGGIGMEQAWDITTGNASVVVAIIDTGLAYETFSDPNPAGCYKPNGALRECKPITIDEYFEGSDRPVNISILAGSDFVNSDDHPNDDEGHGSHVAGTVAQNTNNSLGVAGLAFDTTIMPVKVLDANGTGQFDKIADAIRFATDNGADIINMSLGSSFDAQVMEDAVAYAFNNGVLVVTSAGNAFLSGNATQFPAAYDASVMAVASTRYDETRSDFSSTGPYVDVAAPGGDTSEDQNEDGFADGVLQQTFAHTCPSGTFDLSVFVYCFYQGTSMASPHVAGLAALLLSVDGTLTPTELRTIIETTAEDKGTAGRDDEYGHGIIDAVAALGTLVAQVSITLTTDGITPFGIVPLAGIADTTATGTNDIQTVEVTTGPADLSVKSTDFSAGANTWALGAASGSDQVKWEFSPDSTTWTTFSAADTLFTLGTNVAQGATSDLFLRLTLPTTTSTNAEHTSTVTVVATTP